MITEQYRKAQVLKHAATILRNQTEADNDVRAQLLEIARKIEGIADKFEETDTLGP